MIENVRGLADEEFQDYRDRIDDRLRTLGYTPDWKLLNASDFGVPQLRPRFILVAIIDELAEYFSWPVPIPQLPSTVGEVLYELMASRGWPGAEQWREQANGIAPTIVGGSKKHGGPDLGPTRSKRAWAALGVDGHNIATEPPGPTFNGMPRLTIEMVALLQGFPPDWKFFGKKTNAYRQVGNAFPPPVAQAIGERIASCLLREVHNKRPIDAHMQYRQTALPYD
jgi:DNA (cytosine-5)-methyltransferase 1